MKVLITTVPFAEKNKSPLDDLRSNNIEYVINPFNKKLTESELMTLVDDVDIIIAGTEPITDRVISRAKNLKMISRVGIGLDSVDLVSAEKHNVVVSYTPDAPAPAVCELTVCYMLSLLRYVHVSNLEMHNGRWHRFFGRRLSEVTVGIIGLGRIGGGIIKYLMGFGVHRILVNDIDTNKEVVGEYDLEWASKHEIFEEADIVTIHTPLTSETKNMVQEKQLLMMKKDAVIINTARGGIINESDLHKVLMSGHLSGAAIDVFDAEPYDGPLKEVAHCLLSAHMGSMSVDCRTRMEYEAVLEAVYFKNKEKLINEVPEHEYLKKKTFIEN